MSDQWLLYGANGYTGALTARMAVQAGMRPILSGRNAEQVAALAKELNLDYRTASLDDAAAVDKLLAGVAVVLHCAGPFVYTSMPMADACLRNRVHYLDITGEIPVFEGLAARYDEAKQAGVMLLPGAGFDVVPSDCLAAHLNRRLPNADRLVLGIRALGSLSRGTTLTMLEAMERGESGLIRKNGKLTPVPAADKTLEIDFGRGPRPAVRMPWGDVSTAYHSTGIPNIEEYMALPPNTIRMLRATRYFGWAMHLPGVMSMLKNQVRSGKPGPTDEERQKGLSLLWGKVEDKGGNTAQARLQTPEGYTLTALASLLIVRKVLAGDARPGYQTPSSAFGPDLIMEIPGVERTDL